MKKYPVNPRDYKLYEEIGDGVSATVYRALCIPFNEIVAIKALDLERCNNDLDGIRREVQTMSLIDHPNVVRSYCSFSAGSSLWVVMPYMAGGSCLHIMKSSYPDGFEQPVIATLLYEVLKALAYLHSQGHIHRDVKAGNILLDSKGAVKLGDFGVSACMFDSGDRQQSRNTFVGTPCWMAPEVMQQLHGYDFKADIWSFGITALELAHGHAPFSKYPPMKVLLMTLQNAPPGLDYDRDKRFSKSFKDLVAECLLKDPKKRPTSEKLLKHSFFKHAHSKDLLAQTILNSLPPLGDRYKTLKENEANILRNQAALGNSEELSQREYIRGISAWNFNIEDLRREAALIEESDSGLSKCDRANAPIDEDDKIDSLVTATFIESLHDSVSGACLEDCLEDHTNETAEDLPSNSPVNEVGGCSNVRADDSDAYVSRQKASIFEKLDSFVTDDEHRENSEDEEPGFQCKGRFTVIRPDPCSKDSLSANTLNSELSSLNGRLASSLLQRLIKQNSMLRDEILRLMRYVDQKTANMEPADTTANNERLEFSLAAARERDLQSQVMNMQQSVNKLVEELQRQKLKNAQLERQLTALQTKE
uniref:Protein kinase domain-containing protein n=1 Tax=Kalanchoe fedtschenkoi TaxID=63787 RepID=A0A7N0U129_KALFE